MYLCVYESLYGVRKFGIVAIQFVLISSNIWYMCILYLYENMYKVILLYMWCLGIEIRQYGFMKNLV